MSDPVRVMIVDDSAVIRGVLSRFVESDPGIKVAMMAGNGKLAVSHMAHGPFDVIILDIEMPEMDGLTALPLILKADPHVQVIIASTLSTANAAITLKAFSMGAAECLAKPSSHELSGATAFRDGLIAKVKTLGQIAQAKRKGLHPQAKAGTDPKTTAMPAPGAKRFTLRKDLLPSIPEVIAIGSSTGGPQTLVRFFIDLKPGLKQPIFITQHMPPTFTTALAQQIAKQSGLKCHEAAEGDIVEGGHIYLAPGDFHMTVKDNGRQKIIALNKDPQENFCRPAVDPMLRSIVGLYGKKTLAVIFTGMGSDGLKGCQQVVEAGGTVIAQDEATSVVWGMPDAVAMAGICTEVLALEHMAATVRQYAGGVI